MPDTTATHSPLRSGRREFVVAGTAALLGALLLGLGVHLAAGGELPGSPGPTTAPVLPGPADATAAAPATASSRPPGGDQVQVATLVDPGWVIATAGRTGIPQRALAAYAGTSLHLERTAPGCHLSWNTLAAIGSVESDHGRAGGGRIDDAGATTRPVVGIALDGDGVGTVRDTDDGELDGDTTWDRAVGPMQFIPGTWRSFATDGNADGRLDPQHVDDAALTAGRYLCADGRDLGDPATWIAAIESYNVGVDYNHRIVDAANRYASVAS